MRRAIGALTFLLLAVAVAAAGICAAAWRMQERLIFFPQPIASTRHLPASAQPLEIVASDGARLRGWFVPASHPAPPAIVYFGGNAEEVSSTLADARWPSGWARAAVNYRGYGDSEGEPGEALIVEDARAIHDAIARRGDVDPRRIVAVGRSLGSAVAVALAAARPLAGVVLVSPFDSLVAVGRTHYPFLPVALLLRHRFDAAALAPAIDAPLLAVVAERDSIIAPERSRALYDRWRGPKRWQAIERAGHDDVSESDGYWRAIGAFLAEAAAR